MVIAFKPNVIVKKADCLYEDGTLSDIRMRFNTGHTLVVPKSIFGMLYLLNGHFTVEQITAINVGLKDADLIKVLDVLFYYGLVYEFTADYNDMYVQAQDKLRNFTAYLPKMSNVNMMIAVLLYIMRVKAVFYGNGTVTQNDIDTNIYYKSEDVGKNIILFMQDDMRIDTVHFADSGYSEDNLNKNIIVNSDAADWVNIENCIMINTWNYQNILFRDFELFNGKQNTPDDIKKHIAKFVLAIRSVCDMLHSVTDDLVF